MLNRILVGLSCAVCSLPILAEDVQSYIVNGTATSTSEFPSYARLYHNEYKQFGYCGGTFIDATHVLTAAHCVEFTAGTQSETDLLFTVVIPNLDSQNSSDIANAEKHYVSKYYIHQNHNSPTDTYNDIAILELETAVNISSYATFANSENDYRADATNETFVAVGHGITETGGSTTPLLQKATLTYVAQSSCNEYVIGQAPDTQLCMSGSIVGTLRKSTCSGDSGGPLYWTAGTGTGQQVGITSYGPLTCGNPALTATSVFTEVADYKDWINNVKDGLVSPSYTTSETTRQYYRDNNSLPAASGGGGGGAVSLWSALFLFGALLFRRKEHS